MVGAAGCRSGDDTAVSMRAPEAGTGGMVTVELLLLGADGAVLEATEEGRQLAAYTDPDLESNPRGRAATLAEVKDLGRRMRGMNQLYVMANPDLTARRGTRAILDMPGITPGASLHLEVQPATRDGRLISVNITARFAGEERENRWDRLRYPAGDLAYREATLRLDPDGVRGAMLTRVSGSTIDPAEFVVYVFVTARTPGV